jgi:peptidoglycan/xylan/chitin deacetylase (PgdA/CDA1 family)
MLLILLYHRAAEGLYGNSAETLRSHFAYLRKSYPIVVPGEALTRGRLNICLTFDDAFADFYAYVFPLLKELSLRAVLSVPTGFIVPETNLRMEERLAAGSEEVMRGRTFQVKAPFCTWSEIREMADSGLVAVASHSHQHVDMTKQTTDREFEVVHSKRVVERQIGKTVSTFVYPFGRANARAHALVKQHYTYAMRIGAALNASWTPRRQPLCRVGADGVQNIRKLLRWDQLARYRLKSWGNAMRAAAGKWEKPD